MTGDELDKDVYVFVETSSLVCMNIHVYICVKENMYDNNNNNINNSLNKIKLCGP